MAYELLYTRSISSDDRVRFTDVPITSASIMIEVLSLRSPYYRVSGYAYAIVSDGVSDYERGVGHILPFGKNRLLFTDVTLPYFLEFYPKWGTKQALISVYKGTPGAPIPPSNWKSSPGLDREFKLFTSPAGIQTREIATQSSQFEAAQGAIEGYLFGGYLYWKMPDATIFKREIGVWNPISLVDSAMYESSRTAPDAIAL